MKITTSQLRQIIREEIQRVRLTESLDKTVIKVFGYAGIQTKYKTGEYSAVARYGDKAVEQAKKLAPKYLNFAKQVKVLLNDKTAKELGALARHKADYGGRSSTVGTPIDGLVYASEADINTIDNKFSSFVKTAKKLLNDPMMDDFAKIAAENAGYSGRSDGGVKTALKYISLM
jgi:hypothetical protein